jgi:hypothetical protein
MEAALLIAKSVNQDNGIEQTINAFDTIILYSLRI